MSSSKLDYLSKYYSSSSSGLVKSNHDDNSDADHENRKKKKKKKKMSKTEKKKPRRLENPSVQIIDDEPSLGMLHSKNQSESNHRNKDQKIKKKYHVDDEHDEDDDDEEVLHHQRRYDSDDDEEDEDDGDAHDNHNKKKKKKKREPTRTNTSSSSSDDEAHHTRDTVYRDKHGKKLNMKEERDKQEKQVLESLELQEREKLLLNMGGAQKAQIQAQEEYFKEIQSSTFARSIQDTQLEEWKKHQVREGDPMASYHDTSHPSSNTQKKSHSHDQYHLQVPSHPKYKGPKPKPNRYMLQPGYRWDGVDRGNGFEDLVLAKVYRTGQEKEEAYKRSTADM